MADRHTRLSDTGDLPVLSDSEIAEREASNGLLQYDRVQELIRAAIDSGSFRLRTSTILDLNRVAVDGLEPNAGNFRAVDVEIDGSQHDPPSWRDVPRLVDDLCDDVNAAWSESSALHLAAFTMWRISWIHPFTNGNGRTSRAVSYLVLCSRLKQELPGRTAIPEMIARNKTPYYRALDQADEAWAHGQVDVTAMEELLRDYLAAQLLDVINQASGA